MDDKTDLVADTMELLLMNQTALRAALEEVSLWVGQRGSTQVHDSVLIALQTLDQHAEAITSGIERLRS
ncbi:hypothetical protein BR1R5_36820 [Pseudomonas sp. BR1R-5]|uniref:hypothetical protein n=1 Tax=Pseudomonas sp. BR1R-5 TaxID=3003626 RepID=UPI0022BCB352|nr:hypothetical protein [Pseudomonas sp. BR1R-5]GLH34293.1 hypothetical protein BR1R5_36820 [Pseudomonas sp. BR1R-5]